VDDDEPVVVPIEDALDLHPFAPRDIPSVVASVPNTSRNCATYPGIALSFRSTFSSVSPISIGL